MENIKQLILSNKHKISNRIPKNALPSLTIALSDRSDLSFNQDDLQSVFSVFGAVLSIQIRDEHAIVNFEDLAAAFFAQKCLHNKYVPCLSTRLNVNWRKKNQWVKPLSRRNC